MEGKASEGANQPEVAAIPGFSASWRYSSRLTRSAGLASNGLKKRATCPPRHWVRSAGAVGDSKKNKTLLSKPQAHNPIANKEKSLFLSKCFPMTIPIDLQRVTVLPRAVFLGFTKK